MLDSIALNAGGPNLENVIYPSRTRVRSGPRLRAAAVLDSSGATYTFEDDRFSYGEQRFVTLGLLAGIPVSVVHTESEHEIRVISFRTATKREAQIYFDAIQD